MFSVFVYLYCAAVSLYAGTHFYSAWRRGRQTTHWDFAMLFYFLSGSFLANIAALPFAIPLLSSVFQELADLLALAGLGFVVMAATHFQQIPVRRLALLALVWAAVIGRFALGLRDLPRPVIIEGVIYPNYPAATAFGQGALVVLFATIVGITLLMNLKNLKIRKKMVFFLGGAFLVGGLGGALAGGYDFITIFTGFVLLFISFTMVLLSVYFSRKEVPQTSSGVS